MASGDFQETVEAFRQGWREMADDGECDGYGGAEYMRVFGILLKQGGTDDVRAFIHVHANGVDKTVEQRLLDFRNRVIQEGK